MKVIIAGSRGVTKKQVKAATEKFSKWLSKTTQVVSGTARGADRFGEEWAAENNIEVKRFPADWDTHGKSAGYVRNSVMAEYADGLLAIWDGESRGTIHMINLARKQGLEVVIYTTKEGID